MSSISSLLASAAAQVQSYAASAGSSGDLADTVVKQAAAQTQVSLSMSMIKAEADATQQLVDILV